MIDLNAPIIPNGHFKWKEFLYLPSWEQYADPTPEQIKNAIFLFTKLEPLRLALNKPMEIINGLRTDAYMKYLQSKGVPAAVHSAHNDGFAIDFVVPSMRIVDTWNWFNQHWDGRLEHQTPDQPHIHADARDYGKRERF